MAAHRYWRLYIPSSARGWIGFSEIELRESAGGSDATGSGSASASFEEGGAYVASKAVDDNTGSMWSTYPQTGPQWWAYDFGSGITKSIVEVVITPSSLYANAAPSSFSLQYSDNGSDWTTLYTFSGISWPNSNPQTFTIPITTTVAPTTLAPTTLSPTTLAPTTDITTLSPTTLTPTTILLTTLAPTTAPPMAKSACQKDALSDMYPSIEMDSTIQ